MPNAWQFMGLPETERNGAHEALNRLEQIVLKSGAIQEAAAYIKQQGWNQPIIVADEHTYLAAGKQLNELLEAQGIWARVCLIEPNEQGDVIADEVAMMQLFVEADPERTDCLIAAGSGTLHDITRFVSLHGQIPFVSVPTAPSVDGFTSAGAPIILRGIKKTIQATAPVAIFADLNILKEAPQRLVAAGFGDMLGKYTSLFDWKVSHLTADEPYSDPIAEITERALLSCVDQVDEIGKRSEAGIKALMTALIESGIAMLLFGQSHPASGAEHHVSHYWEMEYLQRGERQLLHGAKVGAACAEIVRLYHEALDHKTYPGAKPSIVDQYGEQLAAWIRQVPEESVIRELMRRAGGPSSRVDLGIDDTLLARSLREAHEVRLNRHTLLRALNEA
ncbi:sn-glycerol-1-phosphate dehydrogenase [Paenibacillus sp. CAA11]|uniref:sn-glycerol-1-phosphate dehydrogenase n=1 Tax=Paenibacillus sp. CAA11 TaxID=1532905 RepID=UPI000D394E0F|nr:sn-glycerol-1-phosphate dehydrogenase [Paenibacillus sp. CAA11]AWB45486.1 sn-glycerol-1-phosphate dehydrogenase [Paenibacillus sp. CAA11]